MRVWSALAFRARRVAGQVRGLPRLRLTGGHVVLPSGVIQADLVIHAGRIAAVEDRPAAQTGASSVDVSGLLIFPGLINAHDHLEFNCFPRLGEPGGYTNSYEWGLDITWRRRSVVVDQVLRIPLIDRLLVGAYRNLYAGVTTVCHHGPYWRLFDQRFPVRVVKRYGWCHSLGFGDDVAGSYRRTPPDVPWIIHLAEGTDARARGELAQLAGLGCLGANTVIVHGVGLCQADLDLMAQHGAGLIWCPASNLFMFGQTAPIGNQVFTEKPRFSGAFQRDSHEHAQMERARVTLALGSDSRLTGSQDLLAELQVAHSLGLASAEKLFHMVTRDAARLLRIDDQVGTIEPGKKADLLILEGDPTSPYQALVGASREAIRLVFVGGRPVYGGAGFIKLFHAWGNPFTSARLGSRLYLVAADPVQRSTRRVVQPELERLL